MPVRTPEIPRPGKNGKYSWENFEYKNLLPSRFGPPPRSASPGPVYNPPTTIGSGPKFSFGKKRKDDSATASPGPKYKVDVDGVGSNKYKKATMKGRGKDYSLDARSPGPCYSLMEYEAIGAQKSKGVTMKGRKDLDKVLSDSPGPGAYNIESIDFEEGRPAPKAASFKGHTNEMKIPDSPGPGAYPYRSTIGAAPAASLKGRNHWDTPPADSPAPNAYSPKDYHKPTAPAVSLSSRQPDVASAATFERSPGPAMYDVREIPGSGSPAAAIRSRQRDLAEIEKSPGPAAYGPGKSALNPRVAASLKGRHKDVSEVERSPGPGAYTVTGTIGQGRAASIKSRHADRSSSISPGPGAYLVGGAIGSDKKRGPTLSSRFKTLDEKPRSPGPVYYPTYGALAQPGRGSTMKGRYPEKIGSDSPGPGAYVIRSDIGSTRGAVGFTSPSTAEKVKQVLARDSMARRRDVGADDTMYVPPR